MTCAGVLPRREKRLIVCLDGTWNSAFEEVERRGKEKVMKPTNALKVTRAVKSFDEQTGMLQVTYYDLGVGALAEYPGTANKLLHTLDRTLGGAWGAGFEGNVEDALNFLVHNYELGDEVYIFGFSRGAAQARAVTHFFDWNGGLPEKSDAYYLPKLFRMYVMNQGRPGMSQEFLKTKNAEIAEENKSRPPHRQRALIAPFRPVRVRYLGVWDTVMALGSRLDAVGERTSVAERTFYLEPKPAQCVEHARQALAIDERRYDFRPEVWLDKRYDAQKMEQRWFAGVHTNVGGGYANDGLANVALHWIVEGATAEQLALDTRFLAHYHPYPEDQLYDSYTRFYSVLDGWRNCSGGGVRSLLGYPPTANLTVDGTVYARMYDPKRRLTACPYRPQNVIDYLVKQPQLPALPNDVTETINQRKRRYGLPAPAPANS